MERRDEERRGAVVVTAPTPGLCCCNQSDHMEVGPDGHHLICEHCAVHGPAYASVSPCPHPRWEGAGEVSAGPYHYEWCPDCGALKTVDGGEESIAYPRRETGNGGRAP